MSLDIGKKAREYPERKQKPAFGCAAMRKLCTVTSLGLLLFLVAPVRSSAAQWRLGEFNAVKTPDDGAMGKLPLGDGRGQVWYWAAATGIAFHPGAAMETRDDSDQLSAGKNASGRSSFEIPFKFDQPISGFRLTTPYCDGIDLGGGDFYIEYATGADAGFKELWRYGKGTPGYAKDVPIPPRTLDWVNFSPSWRVRDLRLRFVLDGFVGAIHFDGKNAGGTLEYAPLALPPAEAARVSLLPDHSRLANTYFVTEPPRIIIDLGLNAGAIMPKLLVYDRGGNREAGVATISRLGRHFAADLPELPPGAYELQLLLPDLVNPILAQRVTLVHPARRLTWEQTRRSPFGIVAINNDGRHAESADLNGPALGWMMGVHQVRGGGTAWCTACEGGRGVYDWKGDPQVIAEKGYQYGLVYCGFLNYTPAWAVDPKRVAKGDGALAYPPKPEYLPDYAEFCRRQAAMIKGIYLSDFEIWNEPNNEPYGGFKGTFDEFVTLCRTAADAVHSVNPKARMILGSVGGADVGYVIKLLKAGLSERFQVVDVHPYSHTNQGPEGGLLSDIRSLQKAIKLYGNHQAIIFSEVGWPTHLGDGGGYGSVTQFQQACFFSRTLLISLAAGVERVHIHMLQDWGKDEKNPEFHFGLVEQNGQPKLAISAMNGTTRHLERAEFLGVVPGAPEFHHAWAWRTPWLKDATLLTIWCDTPMAKDGPRWLDLPAEPVLAENLWGGPLGPDRLRQTGKGWQLLPGEDPLFVYVPTRVIPKLELLPATMRPQRVQRTSAIYKTNIVVDGDLAEWGKLHQQMGAQAQLDAATMGYAGIGQAGKKRPNKARFDVAYNQDGLIVAVWVDSANPMQNDFDHWWIWRGDCVRLYLSTVNNQEYPFMDENHFQIGLAPVTATKGPPQAVQISRVTPRGVGSGDLIPGAKIAARQGQGGWSLEALIPWKYVGRKAKPGDVWGFDLGAGGLVWNGGDDNWFNPMRWGEIRFGPQSM